MGFVSEDGGVTGSIDVNELDAIEPKTDEAKAQIDALKARAQEGNEAADQAAEESVENADAQANPQPEETTTDAAPPFDAPPGQPADGQPPGEQPQGEVPGQPEQSQPEGSKAKRRGV